MLLCRNYSKPGMFNRAYAPKQFKLMKNIHDRQPQVHEMQGSGVNDGNQRGDLSGLCQLRIQWEKANIEALVDKICDEACPAGMAELVQEMSWCLNVLAEETEVNVSSLYTPLWRLSNLNHLLVMLSISRRNVKLYEGEMDRLGDVR